MTLRDNWRVIAGACLLGISVLLQVAPGPFVAPLQELFVGIRGQGTTTAFALGCITILAGLFGSIRRTPARRASRDRSLDPRGSIPTNEPAVERITGAKIDDQLETLTTAQGRARPGLESELRDQLRGVVVRHVQERRDCSRDAAEKMVDNGTWSDDESVTPFLAADASFPLRTRFVDWVSYEPAFVRRYRRVVAAMTTPHGGGAR